MLSLSILLLLLPFNPLHSYSLTNCTVDFTEEMAHVSVSCTDRALTAVPNDIPTNAVSLDLSVNTIQRINRTDLSGLAKLRFLNAILNGIYHIEDGAFSDLVELEELDLGRNVLTNLTDNLLRGLPKLKKLYLDMNDITFISSGAFKSLVSLEVVHLSSNNIQRFADIAPLFKLHDLQELEAGENQFTSFESDNLPVNQSRLRKLLFNLNPLKKFSLTRDVLPDLQYLDLTKCSPGFEWKVSNKTFLRSLTSLLLSGIEISFETYKSILQSAESVEYLWLVYVKEWFDKGLIQLACQMPALTSLDLTFNNIYILNDTLLKPCSQISELRLVGNELSSMSVKSLRGLDRLSELYLDANYLQTVPVAIQGIGSLRVLSLSNNDIGQLGCSDFLNLTGLIQLFLGDNRISRLKACAFQDLQSLRLLYIDQNPIIRVYDTFKIGLRSLRILNMNLNQLKSIEEGDFQGLSKLLILQVESLSVCHAYNGSFNGLESLQTLIFSPFSLKMDMLRGLSNLQKLTVHFPSSLSSLSGRAADEPYFLNVPSLTELIITNNNKYVMSIPADVLRGLKNLRSFSAEKFFSETPHPDTFIYTPLLTSLQIISSNISAPRPELFNSIPNLRSLDLSKNKLRSLDFLVNLSDLSWLKLRENKFTVINMSNLRSLSALRYLDLYGNPFTCDCSNVGFIEWVKSNNRTQVVNAYQYDCSFPTSKQGTKLLDFDLLSCWIDAGFICFISCSSLIVVTLVSSLVYQLFRWHLLYAFHLFLAFLYDTKNRKKGVPHRYDAFVSYNVNDEDWVYREMLPELEGVQGWRLCLHHRDFQPGRAIIENITDAIYSSRKTICVISQRYLQSEWCSREIQMASFRLFDEQRDVLVLLFLEDIPSHQLSPYHRMRKLVKSRTYLSWPQAASHPGLFWQNVHRALETGDVPDQGSLLLTGSPAPDYEPWGSWRQQ